MTARAALRAGLIALTLTLALVAAGCGSGSSTQDKANSWANDACGALVTWKNSVTAAGQSVTKDLSKSSIQNASKQVQDANSKLDDDLKGLGTPPTPGADQAKSSLDQLNSQLKQGTNEIRQAIAGITNASSITTAITSVASSVQAMGSEVQTTVKDLQNAANDDTWKKAFQNSDSCKKLTSSS